MVGAIRRTAEARGAFVVVLAHGHDEAGTVHVLLRGPEGVSLWSEAAAPGGERGWRARHRQASEEVVEATCRKERDFDPDLWLLEVEGEVTAADLLPGVLIDEA